jgi:hypothetical protein
MKLRELIAGWPQWPGWRRYAPAAGSVATHVVLGLALASMLAATSKPQRLGVIAPRQLEVTLVAETPLPPRGIRPTPPEPRRTPPPSQPKAEVLPDAPRTEKDSRKDQKQQQAAAEPSATDEGGVYLGESSVALSGIPLGLRSFFETDPCHPKKGLPRGDCGSQWAEKLAKSDTLLVPTAQQLRRMYPGIIPACPYKAGCDGLPEGKLNNGTRSVFNSFGSPMMAGAGSLGGMSQTVERLGFNPDHTDPGFGD